MQHAHNTPLPACPNLAPAASVVLCSSCPAPIHTCSILPLPSIACPACAGAMARAEIEEAYAIGRRIEAEERCLDNAMLVFTSTRQEVDEQWGL